MSEPTTRVRTGTGGVLPDGTTNHPPIDFDTPPSPDTPDTGAGTPPKRWVVPFPSREALVEHLAGVMRDRAFPEFGAAPPPLWATDAAETAVAFYEGIAKAALTYGGADRAHRLLHSALLWIEWLEEPTMDVRAAWITAARDELGGWVAAGNHIAKARRRARLSVADGPGPT